MRRVVLATLVAMSLLSVVKAALASEDDVTQLAADSGKDPEQLRAAAATVGVPPRQYLLQTMGELPPSPPSQAVDTPGSPAGVSAALARRIECLVHYESGGSPTAVNRSSGAAGLLQFLPSTWKSTPQGRQGLSVFDPSAARAAAAWMLAQGRAREWTPVRMGLC